MVELLFNVKLWSQCHQAQINILMSSMRYNVSYTVLPNLVLLLAAVL